MTYYKLINLTKKMTLRWIIFRTMFMIHHSTHGGCCSHADGLVAVDVGYMDACCRHKSPFALIGFVFFAGVSCFNAHGAL